MWFGLLRWSLLSGVGSMVVPVRCVMPYAPYVLQGETRNAMDKRESLRLPSLSLPLSLCVVVLFPSIPQK